MRSANLFGPLKGLCPHKALIGLTQASGLAGGFDLLRDLLFYRGLSLRRKAQKTEKRTQKGMENRFLIPLYDPIEKRPENRVYIPYIYKEGDTNKE